MKMCCVREQIKPIESNLELGKFAGALFRT